MSLTRYRQTMNKVLLLLMLFSQVALCSPASPQATFPLTAMSLEALIHSSAKNSTREIFELFFESGSHRNKRDLYDVIKQAKTATFLTYRQNANHALKEITKSVFRSVATIGLGITVFNLFQPKIAEVLDFKTRLLKNIVLQDAERETGKAEIKDTKREVFSNVTDK